MSIHGKKPVRHVHLKTKIPYTLSIIWMRSYMHPPYESPPPLLLLLLLLDPPPLLLLLLLLTVTPLPVAPKSSTYICKCVHIFYYQPQQKYSLRICTFENRSSANSRGHGIPPLLLLLLLLLAPPPVQKFVPITSVNRSDETHLSNAKWIRIKRYYLTAAFSHGILTHRCCYYCCCY